MENYRKSSHCTYDIKYHLVWITKYRKPVITGQIAILTRELVRMICQSNEVEYWQDMWEVNTYICWCQYHRICQQASWCSI